MGNSASGRNAGNVASNARAEAECRERFMALFEEKYAHYFEFIGGRTSSKGKARLRCRFCGKDYLFFPSLTRYGRKKPGPYCSHRCSIKANRTNTNIGHRLRKYGSEDKPRDCIKLDKVIERDNGICYICGCKTSKDDHYYRHGWFTIGDSYPTIDHVMPLARGGTHTWDNVRLACRRCNSEKRDSVA